VPDEVTHDLLGRRTLWSEQTFYRNTADHLGGEPDQWKSMTRSAQTWIHKYLNQHILGLIYSMWMCQREENKKIFITILKNIKRYVK
jgi:hypothetical protein